MVDQDAWEPTNRLSGGLLGSPDHQYFSLGHGIKKGATGYSNDEIPRQRNSTIPVGSISPKEQAAGARRVVENVHPANYQIPVYTTTAWTSLY